MVAFQRSLKYHALFHCLFGHELGHTALQTPSAGAVLDAEVIGAFTSSGPMSDKIAINIWANNPAGQQIDNEYRESWLIEFSCDLFGLILFGPAFLAAHRTYLSHIDPDPYHIDFSGPTHPPYALRHKMLRRVMELLDWHTPITNDEFEHEFLRHILEDPYKSWAQIFDDAQLGRAISGIKQVMNPIQHLAYKRPTAEVLMELVLRLSKRLPPILAQVDSEGKPALTKVSISQTLHAGWAYWIGREKLSAAELMTFFEVNRLCDLALLQQRAINDALDAGVP